MAECIDLPVAQGKTNLDGSNNSGKQSSPNSDKKVLPHRHRVSIGSCRDGDSQRRNSSGKQSSPNSGKNVLPNYLRASTGSCHEFCKYGRKHAVEEKASNPLRKKIATPSSDKQNLIKPSEEQKTTVVKVKPSPPSKIHLPEPPEIIKREVFLPSKKVDISSKNDPSNDDKMKEDEKKIRNLSSMTSSVKPKPAAMKPQSSFEISVVSNDRRNTNVRIVTKTGITSASVKKSLAESAAFSSPKRSSISALPSLNARKYKSLKMVSSLKDQNRVLKVESKKWQSNDEKVQSFSARKHRSVKVVMPLKDQSRILGAQSRQSNNDHVHVEEKTLHVVKAETKDILLDSVQGGDILSSLLSLSSASTNPPSLPFDKEEVEEVSANPPSLPFDKEEIEEVSEYSDNEEDDLADENEETVHMDEEETSEGFNRKMPRNCGVVRNEDKDSAPFKVEFRRGKIIDLKSENNGPRRLRFRRGRVHGENQDNKADARRRNSKKREVDGETIDANASLEKVILRHQDVLGKKDDKGLFNNVIEETASKLVESRKGKVKALVGAFETVISLQDSNPSTQTVI